jgi:hypothetical protein
LLKSGKAKFLLQRKEIAENKAAISFLCARKFSNSDDETTFGTEIGLRKPFGGWLSKTNIYNMDKLWRDRNFKISKPISDLTGLT